MAVRPYPGWHELSDTLYWNPKFVQFIEVLDLAAAAGIEGTSLVQIGPGYIGLDAVRDAMASGPFRKGSEKFELEFDLRVAAINAFNDAGEEFDVLSREHQDALHRIAFDHFAWVGFDGPPDQSILVIDRDFEYTAQQRDELVEEWRATTNAFLADDLVEWEEKIIARLMRGGTVIHPTDERAERVRGRPGRKAWMPRRRK